MTAGRSTVLRSVRLCDYRGLDVGMYCRLAIGDKNIGCWCARLVRMRSVQILRRKL